MPCFDKPSSRRIAIAAALVAVLPGVVLAQQDRPGAALPPPSLYDSAGVPLPAPKAQPAPTVAPTATKPSAATPPAAAPAPATPAAAAPAVPSAPAPQVATPGKSSDYATAGANNTLRTGVRGQCLKLGTTSPDRSADQCDAGTAAAAQPVPKSPVVAPPAAPKVEPKMEAKPAPVEVKPLAPQPAKEERALEPESAKAVAAEPAAPPKPAPTSAKETVTLSADTLFSLGSAAIKATAREDLDGFLRRMKGMNFESIKIIGHTDPTGSAEGNIKLSRARAESVKRYLVAKGLDAKRIQTEGMGGSQPVATGLDCSKLPRAAKIVCLEPNRRVEIEVIGVMPKMAEGK